MKKMSKKTISMLLTFALLIPSLTFMAVPKTAKADGKIGIGYDAKANNTIVYYKKAPFVNGAYFRPNGKIPKSAQITSIKSSKKSVAKIETSKDIKKGGLSRLFFVDTKKAGNVKVTVKAKKGNKKYKAVYRFKIINYKNPAASFKLGKKNLTKKYNTAKHYMEYSYTEKRKSFKVNVKAKRGFKLKKLEYVYYKNEKTYTKKIKNGKTLKRVSGAEAERIVATFEYRADKRTSGFCVQSNWKKESLGKEKLEAFFEE